ncbi:MAG: Do family serine endopeptidase [Proteobacteria bacterium]|nr:Do family serine endopeptidase [Pseudomonadota bacterium]
MPRARFLVVTVLALAAVGGGYYFTRDKDISFLGQTASSSSSSAPFVSNGDAAAPYTGIADVLERVTPAVVSIQVKEQQEESELSPLLQDPRFRRFFGVPDRQQQPRREQRTGAGSGVIVDAKEGYVITNFHVVDKAEDIAVTLKDRRTITAKVIGKDQATDLALLKIDAPDLTALPIGDMANLRVGDYVLAVGNPFALGQTVTAGIVSALGRSGFIDQGFEDFIQTDAAINPGNSGGALVNLKGELIGIPTVILSQSGGNVGIGFAVPTSIVTNVMNQLIQSGEVSRGRLGVAIRDLTPDLAQNLGLSINHGALVSSVENGSPADTAGIQAGDVVVAVNGSDIEGSASLRNRVGMTPPDTKLKLSIIRDGEQRELDVTTAKLDPTQAVADAAPQERAEPSRIMGAVFENASGGVRVVDVEENSPAAVMGLQPDDIVTAVNRTQIRSMSDLETALKNVKSQSVVRVKRDDRDVVLIVP